MTCEKEGMSAVLGKGNPKPMNEAGDPPQTYKERFQRMLEANFVMADCYVEMRKEADSYKAENARMKKQLDRLKGEILNLRCDGHVDIAALQSDFSKCELNRDHFKKQRDTLAGVNNRLKFKITSIRNALGDDQ